MPPCVAKSQLRAIVVSDEFNAFQKKVPDCVFNFCYDQYCIKFEDSEIIYYTSMICKKGDFGLFKSENKTNQFSIYKGECNPFPIPIIESGPKTLNYNLVRVDVEKNNKISWNSEIANNSSEIKIRYVFKLADKSVAKEYDVTGTSSHTLCDFPSHFSKIATDVTLIVTPHSKQVRMVGSNKLNDELFKCCCCVINEK